jgi:hypothetical protein
VSERPSATLRDIWRERDAWAAASREGKETQRRARLAALSFATAGATVGTVASVWEFGPAAGGLDWIDPALAILSAVLVALGGYFGRELLTPDRETAWARARLLVEALKRECWRYQMGVPPYDGAEPHAVLRARSEEMVRNRGLERPPVLPDADVSPPDATTVDAYLETRVLGQARYYEASARRHRAERDRLNRLTFAFGALAVVLGVVGSRYPSALAFVPVITTVAAAFVAWIQTSRVGSMISLYQETATQLRMQTASWQDSAAARSSMSKDELRAAEIRLIENCEEVMARENGAWRAEWLSEEKADEHMAALKRVEDSARGAADLSEGRGTG